MKKLCLVDVSIPGEFEGRLVEHSNLVEFVDALTKNQIEFNRVDTVPGWGNLNQDWIEFKCEVDTSWGWCRLMFMTDDQWENFYKKLVEGKLIMKIMYVEILNDGQTRFVDHG